MPFRIKALALLLIISTSQSVSADTIFLKNGDRISGKVMSMHQNKLRLQTSYAEIAIPWADIKNMSSDQSITVELTDGSRLKGSLIQSEQGPSIQNTSLSSSIPLSLDNIVAINPPIISDDAIIAGGIHFGGSKSSGNTDNQAFHADVEIIARAGNNKFSAGAQYNQVANDGKESENNFHIFSQYDHYYMPKWYVSLFTNFTKDRFQDLNFRSAFGVGVGHELWDTSLSFLSAEAGVAYTVEDYEEGTDREFIAGRWGINYHYWVLEDRLKFFHNHEGLVSFEDFSDVLVRSQTGFKLPIYQGLELLAQFDFDYDTKPAEGKKNSDTQYIIGAGFSW